MTTEDAYVLTDENVVQPAVEATVDELLDKLSKNRNRSYPAAGYALGIRVTPRRMVVIMPGIEHISDWETRTGKPMPTLPPASTLTHAQARTYDYNVRKHLIEWKLGRQNVGFMVLYLPDGVDPKYWAPLQKGTLYSREEMTNHLAQIVSCGYAWCHAGEVPTGDPPDEDLW